MVLDGKEYADKCCVGLKSRVDILKEKGIHPELVIVTSGENQASKVYVRNKVKKCEEIGIDVHVKHYDYLTNEDITNICDTNKPIIFQMPMNGEISDSDLGIYFEDPNCDVDGFVSPYNVDRLASGKKPYNYPCTPKGIVKLLDEYKVPIEGKTVCIIGRSNIVGRPLARMMEQRNATVILCHSKTPEDTLYEAINMADIVVSATGVRNMISMDKMKQHDVAKGWFVTEDYWGWMKTFVDVGINRDEEGKLCGDIDPEIFKHCAAYTPIPGGVGPMTVAMLMENTVEYYERW